MDIIQKGFRVILYKLIGTICMFYFLFAILWNSAYLVSFLRSDQTSSANWIKVIAMYIAFLMLIYFGITIYNVFPNMRVDNNGISVTYFSYLQKRYSWKNIGSFERSRKLNGIWEIRLNIHISWFITHGLLFPLFHGIHSGVFAPTILLSEKSINFGEISKELTSRLGRNDSTPK